MKTLLALVLVLAPSFAFAATDEQIKASLTQQLLSMFVVEVNSLDKMQALVAQSSNPSQFDTFSGLVAAQLSQTTSQLAVLLNPTNASVSNVIGGIGTESLGVQPIGSAVPPPAMVIDLKINDSDGPVTVSAGNCPNGEHYCSEVKVSWTLAQVSECGISGPLSVSGAVKVNGFGITKNSSQRIVFGTSKIIIQCNSQNGPVSDSVDVVVQ